MTEQHKREAITLRILRRRQTSDRLAQRSMAGLTAVAVLLVPLIAVALFLRSRSVLVAVPLRDLIFGTEWLPTEGAFGFLPFILGTV